MEIVIVGGGKLGYALCRDLVIEGHEIVLIDRDPIRIEALQEELDIRCIVGNGSARDVLIEADVPSCDVFISVTPADETNVIAAAIAKKLGAGFSIARVRGPEYAHDLDFFHNEFGIGMLINPDAESAADIVRAFDYPAASSIEPFENGKVNLVTLRVRDDAQVIGKSLAEVRMLIPDILLLLIESGQQAMVPSGASVLKSGDLVQVLGPRMAIDAFSKICGHPNRKWSSALIIGGKRISYYLLPPLLRRGIQVKVIEVDRDTANKLAAAFPQVKVIIGDGTNQRFLQEQHLANYDVAVALTNIDEENLMFALFAHQQGVHKTITKVNRRELTRLLDPRSLNTIITPHLSSTDAIIRYIRSHEKRSSSSLEGYARLSTEGAEALAFIAQETDRVTRMPIKDLTIKPGNVIGHILRGEEQIVPSGSSQIQAGDRVLIVSLNQHIHTLDEILKT